MKRKFVKEVILLLADEGKITLMMEISRLLRKDLEAAYKSAKIISKGLKK